MPRPLYILPTRGFQCVLHCLGAHARRSCSQLALACLLMANLLTALCATPARACWDGYVAQHGTVEIFGSNEVWDAEQARLLAGWIVRLQRLVGERRLQVYWGEADFDGKTITFPQGRYDILFSRLATRLGVSAQERRAARRAVVVPTTVQIAATRNADHARAMANQLFRRSFNHALAGDGAGDDSFVSHHGFYEAGGFPSDNRSVHVVEGEDASGAPVYRLVVGAFLDRAEAMATVASLRTEQGISGFVRDL